MKIRHETGGVFCRLPHDALKISHVVLPKKLEVCANFSDVSRCAQIERQHKKTRVRDADRASSRVIMRNLHRKKHYIVMVFTKHGFESDLLPKESASMSLLCSGLGLSLTGYRILLVSDQRDWNVGGCG